MPAENQSPEQVPEPANPAESNNLETNLWNDVVAATYGEDCQAHIFEQYKIMIESADKVSSRRGTANTFFLSLHTTLISAAAYFYRPDPSLESSIFNLMPLVAALVLCYAWWRLIVSYRQLNDAKFKVIGAYEERLPSRPYVRAEWKALGEGKDPKLYLQFTEIENYVPIIFGILYLLIALPYIIN